MEKHNTKSLEEKPLREHFEMDTDAGTTLRTFDYIEALERYSQQVEELTRKYDAVEMVLVKMMQFVPVDERELFLHTLNSEELNRVEVAEIVAMIKKDRKIQTLKSELEELKKERDGYREALKQIRDFDDDSEFDDPGQIAVAALNSPVKQGNQN